MKVKDLIAELQKCDPDVEVFVTYDGLDTDFSTYVIYNGDIAIDAYGDFYKEDWQNGTLRRQQLFTQETAMKVKDEQNWYECLTLKGVCVVWDSCSYIFKGCRNIFGYCGYSFVFPFFLIGWIKERWFE